MKKLVIDEISYNNITLFVSQQIILHESGIHVIIGDNGSGKTSIAKAIMKSYHDEVTMMTQENDVIEEISIIQNICMNVIDEKIAKDFLDRYNLNGLINKNVKKLSGGEKRLILLARAILSPREIIILDEPSNDIDYKNIDVVTRIIRDQKEDKCILLITHDKRIEKLGDYFFVIKDKQLCREKETPNAKEKQISKQDVSGKLKLFYNLKFQYQNKVVIFASIIFLLLSLFDFSFLTFNKRIQDNRVFVSTWSSRLSHDILNERGMDITDLTCAINKNSLACNKENRMILESIDISTTNVSVYPTEFLYESELITYDRFFLLKLGVDSDKYELVNIVQNVESENDDVLYFDFIENLSIEAEMFLSTNGFKRLYHSENPRFEFSLSIYDLFLNTYGQDGKVVSAIIELDESTDFFSWLENNDLYNKSALILSNETDRIMLESLQANRIYQIVITQTINFIVSIFLVFILTVVNERKLQNLYKSLYTYGYSVRNIRQISKNQYKSVYINGCILCLVSVFAVFKFFELNSYIIYLLIPLAYFYIKIVSYIESLVVYVSLKGRKI